MAGYPPGGGGYGYSGYPPGQSSYGAYNPSAPPYQAADSAPPGTKPPKNKPESAPSAFPSVPSMGGAYPSTTATGGYPRGPGGYPPGSGGYPPSGYPPSSAGYPPVPGAYPSGPGASYGSPFGALVPSAFPPGTDPNVVACFQAADQDGSGFIDDKELQSALSSYNQAFSIGTVRLLMYHFTGSNTRKIGPKEFISVFYSLQNWRAIFERFDRDRSGKIDAVELREALLSLQISVSPIVLDLLISKYDPSGSVRAINYDNFIECCLVVRGLTDKFREKDTAYSGSASFTYEAFMLTVLPFLIA